MVEYMVDGTCVHRDQLVFLGTKHAEVKKTGSGSIIGKTETNIQKPLVSQRAPILLQPLFN